MYNLVRSTSADGTARSNVSEVLIIIVPVDRAMKAFSITGRTVSEVSVTTRLKLFGFRLPATSRHPVAVTSNTIALVSPPGVLLDTTAAARCASVSVIVTTVRSNAVVVAPARLMVLAPVDSDKWYLLRSRKESGVVSIVSEPWRIKIPVE